MDACEQLQMKSASKKVLLIGCGLFLGLILFLFGPSAIHAGYRAATPDAVVQDRRTEYQRLANGELRLTGAAKRASETTRGKLYLWFHARGFSIDEGDEETSLWQPWRDLIDYWRGDDGSRFYSTSSR
jgi:hypothetical protein